MKGSYIYRRELGAVDDEELALVVRRFGHEQLVVVLELRVRQREVADGVDVSRRLIQTILLFYVLIVRPGGPAAVCGLIFAYKSITRKRPRRPTYQSNQPGYPSLSFLRSKLHASVLQALGATAFARHLCASRRRQTSLLRDARDRLLSIVQVKALRRNAIARHCLCCTRCSLKLLAHTPATRA